MHRLTLLITANILFSSILPAQKTSFSKLPFEGSSLQSNPAYTVMPYNRMIKSAGKVITYGDPRLENHALDVCVLPGKKSIVIEDRYGIAVADIKTQSVMARWGFTENREWSKSMSTYSGITCFVYKHKTFIAWGAAGSDNAAIMLAEWDGLKIGPVTAIPIEKLSPAENALPNQIISNT